MMKQFKKYYTISAPPEDVYKALTNPLTIYLWTGEEAEMSTVPGSEFSIFSGNICGRNLHFDENKKLVQEWYFGEQDEPSVVTMILHPSEKGTSVELSHINIPDDAFDNMKDGWNSMYFAALKEFYDE